MSLNGSDGDDGNDVFGRAAAGQIIHRRIESLRDGAEGIGACKPLDQLVTDIGGIEVGEDEDVRAASDAGIRRL